MSVVAVIPARYGSTRFPGKPLTDIAGKPMIRKAVTAFGGRAVMTSSECASGTDRVAQAVAGRGADFIVNVQGDQVILDLEALAGLVRELKAGEGMATIATRALPEERDDQNCVKVVCDTRGYALYFSRSPIPYPRNTGHAEMLKHIGIYGFGRETLQRFTRLPSSPLERTESLEQLRALENGIPIKVIVARGEFFEINTPEDREKFLTLWQG